MDNADKAMVGILILGILFVIIDLILVCCGIW